jgi:hypothetical protein
LQWNGLLVSAFPIFFSPSISVWATLGVFEGRVSAKAMRKPCCDKQGNNKGAWSTQEDQKLIDYIQTHGEGCWRSLPEAAGIYIFRTSINSALQYATNLYMLKKFV